MKTFTQWAEDKKYTLPTVSENTRRNGVRAHAYPEIYSRGQYTDADLRTTAADAVTYQNMNANGNVEKKSPWTLPD